MSDRTIEHLQRLDPAIQTQAWYLVAIARRYGIPLVITSSTRTPAEQSKLVAMGRSKTFHSKHITGKAFDIDVLGMSRDRIPDWVLRALGNLGEQLGMRWGGRFKGFYDPGHFEI